MAGHGCNVPKSAPLASSVPGQSGVSQGIGRITAGSELTGKNVPANNVMGTSTKRKNGLNVLPSPLTDAAKATTGAANATPVRMPNTSESSTIGLVTAPTAAATARK